MFFVLSRVWDKQKKFWVPWEIQILCSDALPLSHRDSTVREVYYKVYLTPVLNTTRISNVDSIMFVHRIREIVSFELSKETKKDVFCLVTSAGQGKNFESPWEIQILCSDALPLSHRDSTVREVYYKVYLTPVLNTTRISNVDSIMFVHRIREIVSFELSKETKKDVFCLVTSAGQGKNSDSPWEIQILCSNALLLSQRDSMVSEVYYEVHMTCVLHTARISNVDSLSCLKIE